LVNNSGRFTTFEGSHKKDTGFSKIAPFISQQIDTLAEKIKFRGAPKTGGYFVRLDKT